MFDRLAAHARSLGILVAVVAISGGVAAAAQNSTSLLANSTAAPEATPSVLPTTTPPSHPAKPNKPSASPTSTVTPPSCPAGVKNHGQYVSSVAHSAPKGPGHGALVAAAAQSDCGKNSPDATESNDSSAAPETESSEPSESPEASESDDAGDSGATPNTHSHGHGHH